MGTAAAWALASPGRSVLLVEQFAIGHTNGSSHGGSRIFRYAHPTTDYAAIMPGIGALWRQIEQESGNQLLLQTGALLLAPEDDPFIRATHAAFAELGLPCRTLGPDDLAREYPQFRIGNFDVGLYDPHGGILAASTAVATMARLASERGCSIREHTRVLSIEPEHGGARLYLGRDGGTETVFAKRLIICAGPWASKVLDPFLSPRLPLTVTHQQVAYFAVRNAARWSPDVCPVYIFSAEPHVYGFPIFEQPGRIKVAREFEDTIVDPDDARRIDSDRMANLSATIQERFVDIDPAPVGQTACLYTEAPGRDFFIDRHPDYPRIVIAAGFSGRGFKFAPGVGRLLAWLATSDPGDAPHPFWLNRFRINRSQNAGATPDLFSQRQEPEC